MTSWSRPARRTRFASCAKSHSAAPGSTTTIMSSSTSDFSARPRSTCWSGDAKKAHTELGWRRRWVCGAHRDDGRGGSSASSPDPKESKPAGRRSFRPRLEAPPMVPRSMGSSVAIAIRFREAVSLAGRFPLLAGVTCDVAEGEIVHLRGPNGAGKTSFLRACAGLVPISLRRGLRARLRPSQRPRGSCGERWGPRGSRFALRRTDRRRQSAFFDPGARRPLDGLDDALAPEGLRPCPEVARSASSRPDNAASRAAHVRRSLATSVVARRTARRSRCGGARHPG